jgi:hypothetical protein
VTKRSPIGIIVSPDVDEALDWIDEQPINFALQTMEVVFVADAYEAWKALRYVKPDHRDLVLCAYYTLDPQEAYDCKTALSYLDTRGWHL